MRRAAVFLDKDGTLVANVPYNADPERVVLTGGAREAVRLLDAAGYQLVVVSNQSGVARGFFEEDALGAVETNLRQLLGLPLAGVYYCPHHPDGIVPRYAIACGCRKPAPGLILRASEELDLDPARSWMIGDILNDVEAGHRAGARTILVDSGNETEWIMTAGRVPDYRAQDLVTAAEIVMSVDGRGR